MIRLAIKNTKKKIKNYIPYIISLVLIYGLIYGFNHLVFSKAMRNISTLLSSAASKEFFAIIIIFSIVIAAIEGWFICYMNSYMLKKRSKEIAIYMTLGVSKKKMKKLILLENIVLMPIIVILGTVIGCFFALSLEHSLNHLLGINSNGSSILSIKSIITCISYYLISILISSIFLNKKLNISSINALLLDDRSHEKVDEEKDISKKMYFKLIASILIICLSIYLLTVPNNNIMVIFLAIPAFIVSIILLFNNIIPSFLIYLNKKEEWKYRGDNLFIVRLISFRLKKTKMAIGIVTALLTASIICLGISGVFLKALYSTINDNIFDLFIISYKSDERLVDENESLLEKYFPNGEKISYNIYSNGNKEFKNLRDVRLNKYLEKNKFQINATNLTYSEFQDDKYMMLEDYNNLRKEIGLESIELRGNEIAIHCLPYLEDFFKQYGNNESEYTIKEVSTDRFSQHKNYVNGQDFIVIVNKEQIPNLKVDYSIIGLNLNDKVDNSNLSRFLNSTDIKKINYGMSISLDEHTTLLKEGSDTFIGGKFIEFSQSKNFLMIISLAYISIVLVIMALEILSFEFMNQLPLYRNSYSKISIQGYNNSRLKKILQKHINSYFLATGIPTCIFAFLSIYIFSQVYWMKTYEIPLTNIKVESFALLIIVLLIFVIIQSLLLSYLYFYLKKHLIDKATIIGS